MTRFLSSSAVVFCLAAAPWLVSAPQRTPSARPQSAGTQDTPKREASPAARPPALYEIGPMDVLDISVWKEPDVSRSVTVRPDGKISLPLLNDIQAAGFTPMDLAVTIRQKLRTFLTDPQVTVTVTTVNSQRVYVIGEVNRPGTVTLLPGMTVLQALASAGGLSQFANQKKIYVLRTGPEGKEVRHPFNYKEAIRGSLGQDIALRPGDTIVVP
jgi:polysaccharide export outer membrane protein